MHHFIAPFALDACIGRLSARAEACLRAPLLVAGTGQVPRSPAALY